MSDDGRKQRVHDRYDVGDEYESIDDMVNEYATNISQGGAFIRTKASLPIGTELNLNLPVINDDDDEDCEDLFFIKGIGRVVRQVTTPGEEGVGVVFVELTPESKALVESLTSAQPEGDEAPA